MERKGNERRLALLYVNIYYEVAVLETVLLVYGDGKIIGKGQGVWK